MSILKISHLIGLKIEELRFHYIPENEYELQSFYSYIKLSNETIIAIPKYSDNDCYMELTTDNINHLKIRFDTGNTVNEELKAYYVGQYIVNFYFSYYNCEVDIDISAFIKLSNGFYLSENNSGPVGLTNIDLLILNEQEFIKEVERLNGFNVTVRSFIQSNNRH